MKSCVDFNLLPILPPLKKDRRVNLLLVKLNVWWITWAKLKITQHLIRFKNVTVLNNSVKALYYRDLIWKVWFNSNWRIKADSYSSGNLDPPRFFVGRGNNSKLVKALMGRRWWWKL